MHFVARGVPPAQTDKASITNVVKQPATLFFRCGRDLHSANGHDQTSVLGQRQVLFRSQDAVLEHHADFTVDRHNHSIATQDRQNKALETSPCGAFPDSSGQAVKAMDRDLALGAVIGKAMEPPATGEKGLVFVLVALQ